MLYSLNNINMFNLIDEMLNLLFDVLLIKNNSNNY